jgi:fermentation-respiration switch protein FrsA (DUF1100 family)
MIAKRARVGAGVVALLLMIDLGVPCAQTRDSVRIRGQQQEVYVYGTRGADPIIVSSGDGGWIHLGVHVAEMLAARGYFVVGFDAKAYLRSFTDGRSTLKSSDVPGDYAVLAEYAGRGATKKPILVGVSEGAGLSVLAASEPAAKDAIAGVIGLGLPETNELGWRWKDSLIYVTHGVPNEPTFSVSALVGRVAPIPLAAIHSTRDEFVPVAEAQRIFERAGQPSRLWIVSADDHRFSNNLPEFDERLLEAVTWIREHPPQ